MSLPFRTAIVSTPAPALAAGAVPERVEDTMHDAGSATDADSRLRGWINHHDERVPLALIDGALAEWIARQEGWTLHLYARAMRDAERDGVCWTPLLDRMAVAGVWPTQKGRVVFGGKVSVVHPLPVAQVLEPLRLWLREQTDGAALAPMAVFKAATVRALLQSRLAVLPAVAAFTGEYPLPRGDALATEQRPPAADAAVSADVTARAESSARATGPMADVRADEARDARSPAPASTLAAPATASTPTASTATASTATVAAQAAIAPAVAPSSLTPQGAAPSMTAAAAVMSSPAPAAVSSPPPTAGFGPHGVATAAAVPPRDHAAPAPKPTPSHAVPVVEPQYTSEQVTGLMSIASQATGRTEEAQVRPEIRRAINTLIEYRALPSEKLYNLYSACRLVKTWVVRIVGHVSATIELWRAALRDNNWIEVREAIMKSATARRDSVIRLILSRSGSSDVLCSLCLDGDMPDVPQIARRVRAVNPRGLLDALLVAARTTGLRLTAMDLSPLVHHDDPDVRKQAMSLLHLLVRPA